jgi:SRSO17 transposase|tara:strand:+ start:213 stop:2342 length:2130 start_codon:yes stop_codon:yes gene_type:complete
VGGTEKGKKAHQVLADVNRSPLCCDLGDLTSLHFERVCDREQDLLWNVLVNEYHYLGHQKMVGSNLKYLAFCGKQVIAAMGWRAASLWLEARDCYIGWTGEQRKAQIGRIANNNRMLIMPWVRVRFLVSHLLSKNIKLLVGDWEEQYGYKLLVLETFVDGTRFRGTSYQASNWIHVGQTKGYTKIGSSYVYHGRCKEVYLYVVEQRFRRILNCRRRPIPQRSAKTEERERELEMIVGIKDWDPDVFPQMELTEEDMEMMANELVDFHRQFNRYYKRREHYRLGLAYLRGLFTKLKRKTAEGIALLLLGPKSVRSEQDFISTYRWDDKGMLEEYQRFLAEEVSTEDGMLSVDSSEFVKKGSESVGVGRQYCGTRGKVENCQSGVFVGYAGENGYGLIDCQLFLPESWFEEVNAERWQKCHIPDGVESQTKVEIAKDLIKRVSESGLFHAKWLGCDATFGRSKAFLDEVGKRYWYFAQVPSDTLLWTEKPQLTEKPYSGRGRRSSKPEVEERPITVADAASEVSLKLMNLGEGAKGPILAEVAAVQVWEMRNGLPGERRWLFIRRYADGKMKYALSNAPAETSLEQLIDASMLRWPIEQCFQEDKQQLGMNEYEHRSWAGWHRHMLFVFMAQLFLLKIRRMFKKNSSSNPCASPRSPCGYTRTEVCDTEKVIGKTTLPYLEKPFGILLSSKNKTPANGQRTNPTGLLSPTN